MPLLTITESPKELLDEAKLSEFEAKMQISLPSEYRNFLPKHNGGRPSLCDFKFKGSDKGTVIHSFLGLTEDSNFSLLLAVDALAGRLPKRLLPIGYDCGSNQICISVSGDDMGKIYLWLLEFEADRQHGEDPETVENLILLADSFEEFLKALQ